LAWARLQLPLRAPLVWSPLSAPAPCPLLLALPMATPLLQKHEKKAPELRPLLALLLSHSSPPLVWWRPPERRRAQVCAAPVCRAVARPARAAPLAPTNKGTPMGNLLPEGYHLARRGGAARAAPALQMAPARREERVVSARCLQARREWAAAAVQLQRPAAAPHLEPWPAVPAAAAAEQLRLQAGPAAAAAKLRLPQAWALAAAAAQLLPSP